MTEPRIVEIVGFGVARNGGRSRLIGRGGLDDGGAKVLRDDRKESGAERNAEDDNDSDENRVRSF